MTHGRLVEERRPDGPAAPVRGGGRETIRHVGRLVLLGVLGVHLLVALWALPRDASQEELRAALAEGRVTVVGRAENPGFLRPAFSSHPDRMSWVDVEGDRWATEVPGGLPALLVVGPPGSPGPGPEESAVVDAARDRFARLPRSDRLGDLLGTTGGAAGVVYLAVLVTLVLGAQPRRATKWAWFWLLGLPFAAGPALLLLRDAPWSPAARRLPVPLPPGRTRPGAAPDRRVRGVRGLAGLLAASVLATPVLTGLARIPPVARLAVVAVLAGAVAAVVVTVRRRRAARAGMEA